eukprot:TRINITY_DN18136_c0_g2_i1.p1 TRINITY_DN18136_c0_g2~~TRINITY_DN18136_c0_g2_i1.p1  ORF type:complete len:462 (-),score=48.32 TRINITY_DN18136_c0_g2_i1:477-1862(-)
MDANGGAASMPTKFRQMIARSRNAENSLWGMRPFIATWLVPRVRCGEKVRVSLPIPARNSALYDSCDSWCRGETGTTEDTRLSDEDSQRDDLSVCESFGDSDDFGTDPIESYWLPNEETSAEHALYRPLPCIDECDGLEGRASRHGVQISSTVGSPKRALDCSSPCSPCSGRAASDHVSRARSTSDYSSSSIHDWHRPEETILFLDWDDTLCPTNFIEQVLPGKWSKPSCLAMDFADESCDCALLGSSTLDPLRRHESTVISFLKLAAEAGKVVIVTLGTKSWVERSMREFMPRLIGVLDDLRIEIIHAREAVSRRAMSGAILDGLDPWVRMKREAMKKSLCRFYSRRRRQSWKNCISVGDSVIERDALHELTFTRRQLCAKGLQKPVRCKTIKFVERPSLEALTKEIELLCSCFPALVAHDGDFSCDFQDGDDEAHLLLCESLIQSPLAGKRSAARLSFE